MIFRILTSQLQEACKKNPVVTLLGPRQAGKSTLVQQTFPHFSYANLERPDLRRFAQEDPQGFLLQYPAPAIYDEVQRVPELLSWIQVDVDKRTGPGHYILTGSNQPELGQAISQSLAGRTAMLKLLPLSLEELTADGRNHTRDEILFKGFLPRVHQYDQDPAPAYQDYFSTYLERDLRQLIQVKNLNLFELFLKLLAGRVGQLLNLHALSADVGVSSTTLSQWLSILEASFIVFRLPPWHVNRGNRLVKHPKLYFLEPGLAASLLQITSPGQVSRDPLLGGLFENMVVVEALKALYNRGRPNTLTFFRDDQGHEVDLILELQRRPLALEIKSARTWNPDFFKGLKYFENRNPESLPGCLLYGGEESLNFQDRKILPFYGAAEVVQSTIDALEQG